MITDLTPYRIRNVFWGREHPIIATYHEGVLTGEWRFTSNDNYRMNIRCAEILDGKNEMEDGTMRKRVRGYRLYVDFSVSNVQNRDLLIFLRKMWIADTILITPHRDAMVNPLTNTFEFEMLVDGDFVPQYFDGRFIGHEIPFTLESVRLFDSIPEDRSAVKIVLATTKREGGTTAADRQTSVTYYGEKLFYGGWELTEDDLKSVAFWEQPENADEIDPYGQIW
jgi:hypothetical protein